MWKWRWLVFAFALANCGGALFCGAAAAAVRIKDIVSVQGVRENQLVGYGLVIGIKGTGDTMRNSPYTEQSLQSLLDRMGINVRNQTLRARNVAAVMVTADFPAFGVDLLHKIIPGEHAERPAPVLFSFRSSQEVFDFALQHRYPFFQFEIT